MTPEPPLPQPAVSGLSAKASGLVITAVFALSSLLGLVLLTVVARWLPQEQNGQFLALWSLVFGIGGALSAVDAESSRLSALAAVTGRRVSPQVWRVGAVGIIGGSAIVTAAVLTPGVGDLLRSSPVVFGAVLAAVVLFTPLCLTRGVLMGQHRILPYAWVVFGEALLRLVVACVLWLAVEPSVAGAVIAVAVGGLSWLPVAWLVRSLVGEDPTDVSWRSAVTTVTALGSAQALTSLLLAAYPFVITVVMGSTRGMEVLLAALILTRIPLVAIAPIQAVAVPLATRALHSGRVAQIRALWLRAALGLAALATAGFAGGWLLGPWALGVFQGAGYHATPAMMAWLFAATFVLAVALPQLAVLVAAERHTWVTAVWVLTLTVTFSWLFWGPGSPSDRAMTAFVLSSATVYVLSSAALLIATAKATPTAA